jgi:hypothetical protein
VVLQRDDVVYWAGDELEECVNHEWSSPNDRVLGLLYPQGLSGGYRNQVIKLIGFVTHGIWKGYKYILLESLQCETHIVDQRTPIYFDLRKEVTND